MKDENISFNDTKELFESSGKVKTKVVSEIDAI
ncbi:MAG: hypothetical protein ACI8UX_001303 [Psychromonas sp.]|jgi:hypothetical protein